jgi:glutamate-ammonia-ligase adenylyltransferase
MAQSVTLAEAARASASPDVVSLAFERIADTGDGRAERLAADPVLASVTAAVVAASRSLGQLVVVEPGALDVLAGVADAVSEFGRRPFRLGEPVAAGGGGGGAQAQPVAVSGGGSEAVAAAESPEQLALRKRLGLLGIAARDLAGLDDLEQVGESLADLADAVLEAACRIAGDSAHLAVIGMGKHGARELNYASDVDVVFVGDDPGGVARRVLTTAGVAFRIDTDLRPEGRSGALVRSLDSYRAYWERWARPWEFQALLKARPSAGDPELGAAFAEAAGDAVWGRRLDADDLAELRAMKHRAEELLSRRGLSDREIKRGRGGIRDIEFSVQLLQLVHGAADAGIRCPATLPALTELATAGYVDAGDAAALALAYRFLRTVEHRLQLVDEAQVHTVPEGPAARDSLARVLGVGHFDPILARYQSATRSIHERLFFRPLLEVFSAAPSDAAAAAASPGGRWSEEAAEERLAAFGFRQADRTRQALTELTRGLTRSSRLMQQLLPVLLGWLSDTPDPDQGLLALRTLVALPHRRDVLEAAWRESPELARRLCILLGTGRQVGELVGRHPQAATSLDDDLELDPPDPANLVEQAVILADLGPDRAGPALRRMVESATLRLIAADLLHRPQLLATAHGLAAVGDAALAGALHLAAPRVPMAVVAMGRLGGEELAYGSDLDVLFVYDGSGPADAAAAEEAAVAIFRLLNGATPAERILPVDASLRPEGRQGPLARSLEAYAEYHRRWGETWERQALLRARPVTGDLSVLDRFMTLAGEIVWGQPLTEDEIRSIRRMKARTERERIPAGEDPQFHFKLGKGSLADVEWTAQLLQLEAGIRSPGTLEVLEALVAAGRLEPEEGAILTEAYQTLAFTRSRWHLVGNFVAGAGGVVSTTGSDSLPQEREALARLARSLETSPVELREMYRRVTRRARRVVERRFYGL